MINFSIVLLLWLLFILAVGSVDSNNIPSSELNTLHDLYVSNRGQNWTWGQQPGIPWNFSAAANPCVDFWEGVGCTSAPEDGFLNVETLNLCQYGLKGYLPMSIGNLTQLMALNLTNNLLSGAPLPETLGNLPNLQSLLLRDCGLYGPIPRSIGNLERLVALNFQANDLSGTLADLCSLTNLEQLILSYNNMYGPVPPCLGNLTLLRVLDVAFNDFEGSLPSGLGNLQRMQFFNVGINKLNGTIPSTLSAWTNLQMFLLEQNLFSGTLPEYLDTLTALEHISVNHNLLTGTIPARIGDLPALEKLFLQDNLFNHTIPASLTQLARLLEFNAADNFLTGTLPSGFNNMQNLAAVNFRFNKLSGAVPRDLLRLPNLFELMIEGNGFTGTLPDIVAGDGGLAVLLAGNNFLTGPVPSNLINSNGLIVLDVGGNLLTGAFPSVLTSNGSELFYLSAGANFLTGTFPAFDVSCFELAYLNMSMNYISGSISDTIGGLYSLDFLHLYTNLLTGALPDVWGDMQYLSFLTADDNLLSGTIPTSIGDAALLQSLNLSFNHLFGSIPQSLAQLAHLSVLLLMDNKLTGDVRGIFDPYVQNLTTIQLSNNQLSGPLPDDLDLFGGLNVFAAVSNCFTGSIPLSLCDGESLITLALDGLQAATSCQQRLFPAALEGTVVANSLYSIRSPLTGGVPACLFSMSNLTTLHLSGNELTGSLPPELKISPRLQDLSLSHNKITGSLPSALLQRNWRNLDLSYNVFVGSLDEAAHASYDASTAISLDNNRLSGVLPDAFADVDNVNVLQSNLFSCKADRSDLPRRDPNQGKYDCASTNFDASLYAWLAVVGVAAGCVLVLYCARGDLLSAWRGRVIKQLQVWMAAARADTPQYAALSASVLRVAMLSTAATVYILLVLLPIYAVCSALYGTYTHQYAYALSAAYLSGTNAFAWTSTFLVLLWLIVFAMLIVTTGTGARGPLDSLDATLTAQIRRRSLAVYVLTAMLNFAAVLGINSAYVIIALNRNGLALTFTQIALALFKVAFNSLCSPALLRWTSQRFAGRQPSPASFVTVQLFVSIVNNILVPCLVVSIISPDCFYNIFKTAAKVDTEFSYNGQCQAYSPFDTLQFDCTEEAVAVAQTSYSPPFDYSYQCSSSFITYYAPAYVIMCIIAGFALPVAQMVLQRLHARAVLGTRWFAVLDMVLPRVLKPVSNGPELEGGVTLVARNLYSPIFDASQHLITLLTYSALLLTYGAVFPPLAVCFALTIICMMAFTKLKVGRFLVNAVEANQPGQVASVEQECAGVGEPGILVRAAAMIAVSAGVFYTLFLFDTLGDRWDLSGAYWVLIVTPLLAPSALLALYFMKGRLDLGSGISEVIGARPSELELSVIASCTLSPLSEACN